MQLGLPYRDLRVIDPMVRGERERRERERKGKRAKRKREKKERGGGFSSRRGGSGGTKKSTFFFLSLSFFKKKQQNQTQTPSASAESATVFIRERAIGFAIEGVRAVVCADQVLVLGVPPQNAGSLPSVSAPNSSAATATTEATKKATAPWAVAPPPVVPSPLAPNGPPLPSAPFLRDLVARLTEKRLGPRFFVFAFWYLF